MAADAGAIGRIAVATNTAGAAAAISASITAWLLLGKPDLSMILNGALAGLVAITASCAFVSISSSLIIGLIAGFLVVVSVLFFDKIKIDDPVGATSVHLVSGVFGTLCVGLFAQAEFTPNTTGNGLFFGGGAGLLMIAAGWSGGRRSLRLRHFFDLLENHCGDDRDSRVGGRGDRRSRYR